MTPSSDGHDDDYEEKAQDTSNDKDRILAMIHRMKCEGAVFQTICDIPDPESSRDRNRLRGFTMFESRGKFGKS